MILNKVKDYNLWFGIIGLIGTIISLYTFLSPSKPNLEYSIITNTNILDVREKIKNLTVIYDSIDITNSNKAISMLIVDVKNNGTKNIIFDDFDKNSDFGLSIKNGNLLQKPEIISSSNQEYYKDVIRNFNDSTVNFNIKLIDIDNYFRIKLLIIHPKNITPSIESIGKISGNNEIKTLNLAKDNIQMINEQKFTKLINILSIVLISILSILSLSLYKNLIIKEKKYNNLISNSKIGISTDELDIDNPTKYSSSIAQKGELLNIEEIIKMSKGDKIIHNRFGLGKILDIEEAKDIKDSKITILFDKGGTKRLLIRFATLYKLKNY